MTELTWVLVGFSIGGLIFSLLLRREQIKAVSTMLMLLWIIIFSIEFAKYWSAATLTPSPPPGFYIIGWITIIMAQVRLLVEIFPTKKGGE